MAFVLTIFRYLAFLRQMHGNQHLVSLFAGNIAFHEVHMDHERSSPTARKAMFPSKKTLLEVEDHAICLQKAKYLVESLMMVGDGGDGYILFTFLGPQFLVLKNQRRHSPLEQAPNTCFTTLFLRYL